MLLGNKPKSKKNIKAHKNVTGIIKRFNVNPIFLLVLCLCFLVTISLINSPVSSAKTVDKMNIDEETSSYLYYQALSGCIKTHGLSMNNANITDSDAKNFNWFAGSTSDTNDGKYEGGTNTGADYSNLYTKTDEPFNCTGKPVTWIQKATELWGYKDGIDALCDFGVRRVNNSDCRSGSGLFISVDTNSMYMNIDTFQKNIKTKVYSADGVTDSYNLTSPVKYHIYRKAFFSGCLGDLNAQPLSETKNGDKIYNIQFIDPKTGGNNPASYQGVKSKDWKVVFYLTPRKWESKTCSELESELANDTNAKLYGAAIKANIDSGITEPDLGSGDASKDEKEEVTCGSTISVIGWIMCPVINGLVALDDAMWNVVSSLLMTNPLNQTDSIYKAWSAIRNIANIAFVIVFLIIIFSQVSSLGVGNYGIKKLLPRLIICAILVNISFFVVQVMVDVANICGSSIYNVLISLANSSYSYDTSKFWLHLFNNFLTAGTLAAGTPFAVALAAGSGEVLLWILLPVLVMATLAFLAALFTLIIRTALIPILAILVPLAFVAYLLPNTEQWFKKWKDLFVKMLMLYPLAAIVFGGARLAGFITIGDGGNLWNNFVGGIIMTLPLFSLPFLAKQGGDILSKVNGALMGLAEKARNPLNNYAKGRRDYAESKALANDPGPGNPFGFTYRAGRRAYRNRKMRALTRQADTETNREDFKSDWARDDRAIDDETGERIPLSKEQERASRRRGSGYMAVQRSIGSKKTAEALKQEAENTYLHEANRAAFNPNNAQYEQNRRVVDRLSRAQDNAERVKNETEIRQNNNDAFRQLRTQNATDKLTIDSQKLGINAAAMSSEAGQAALKSSAEHKMNISTAENNAGIAFESDKSTFRTRVNNSISGEKLTGLKSKTNSEIAAMGVAVKKLDENGQPVQLEVGGVPQVDSNGEIMYEYEHMPSDTDMSAYELSEASAQLHDANQNAKVYDAAEKTAKGFGDYMFNQDVVKDVKVPGTGKTMAEIMGGNFSETSTFNKKAYAMQQMSKDSDEDAAAAAIYFARQGFGNKESLAAMMNEKLPKRNSEGKFIDNPIYQKLEEASIKEKNDNKNLPPDEQIDIAQKAFRDTKEPPYLPDDDDITLNVDQLKAPLRKIIESKHQPTIKKLLNWLAESSDDSIKMSPEEKEKRQTLIKELVNLGYKDTAFGGSATDRAKNGVLKYYDAMEMKAIDDGKWSPSVVVSNNDDRLESLHDTITSHPITDKIKDKTQLDGRVKIYQNILAASKSSSLWGQASDLQISKLKKIASTIKKEALALGINPEELQDIKFEKNKPYENS